MNASPTRFAAATVLLAVLAAIAEVALAASMTTGTEWLPSALSVPLAAFLAGPLLFLALLAWRRRAHPGRCRLLLAVTLAVGGVGVALLANDFARFRSGSPGARTPGSNPVLLPVIQWLAVLAVWVLLVLAERSDQRATASPGKPP